MAAVRGMGGVLAVVVVAVMWCSAAVSAQTDCSTQFNDLATCFDYVNSNVTAAPSAQCCTAFKSTEAQYPVCLCQLQQAFDDPVSAPGNVTRANQIPALCAVAVDPSRCPALLGLAPEAAPMVAPTVAPVAATPSATPTIAPTAPAPVSTPVTAPVAAGPNGMNIDCSNEFSELTSCFQYVTSNDTKPSTECCSALLQVHLSRPVCLCQILNEVKSGDPSTAGLNVTKGLELPAACNVNADVNSCPALLGQPMSSPLPESPMTAPTPTSGAGEPSAVGSTAPDSSNVGSEPNDASILSALNNFSVLFGVTFAALVHIMY